MKRFAALILALVLVLALAGSAVAGVPDKPSAFSYAYDFTGKVLSDSDISEIAGYGQALYDATGVQAIAVVVDFLDGADPADYATDIINTWGVGSSTENDGVVVLLARGDRKVQIGTGTGIDRVLTGSRCGKLIDANIDYFANNQFDKGMRALYEDVRLPAEMAACRVRARLLFLLTQLALDHGELIAAESDGEAALSPCVLSAVRYIDAHFREELTLDDLAGQAGLARSYFSAAFKRAQGMTPWDYLISKRIDYAIALMVKEGKSVTAAATQSGFNSTVNFNRAFRKYTGKTPTEYLRTLRVK